MGQVRCCPFLSPQYLLNRLSQLDTKHWEITEHTFTDTTPSGEKPFSNIIATLDPHVSASAATCVCVCVFLRQQGTCEHAHISCYSCFFCLFVVFGFSRDVPLMRRVLLRLLKRLVFLGILFFSAFCVYYLKNVFCSIGC